MGWNILRQCSTFKHHEVQMTSFALNGRSDDMDILSPRLCKQYEQIPHPNPNQSYFMGSWWRHAYIGSTGWSLKMYCSVASNSTKLTAGIRRERVLILEEEFKNIYVPIATGKHSCTSITAGQWDCLHLQPSYQYCKLSEAACSTHLCVFGSNHLNYYRNTILFTNLMSYTMATS